MSRVYRRVGAGVVLGWVGTLASPSVEGASLLCDVSVVALGGVAIQPPVFDGTIEQMGG